MNSVRIFPAIQPIVNLIQWCSGDEVLLIKLNDQTSLDMSTQVRTQLRVAGFTEYLDPDNDEFNSITNIFMHTGDDEGTESFIQGLIDSLKEICCTHNMTFKGGVLENATFNGGIFRLNDDEEEKLSCKK